MLEVPGIERISARTMNVYFGHMQYFFGWAVNNGYATANIFQGQRVKRTARGDDGGPWAYTAPELHLMFSHLAAPGNPLVKKDVQK